MIAAKARRNPASVDDGGSRHHHAANADHRIVLHEVPGRGRDLDRAAGICDVGDVQAAGPIIKQCSRVEPQLITTKARIVEGRICD